MVQKYCVLIIIFFYISIASQNAEHINFSLSPQEGSIDTHLIVEAVEHLTHKHQGIVVCSDGVGIGYLFLFLHMGQAYCALEF